MEPYISMVSPGDRTPALNASAQASTVPAVTGVPSDKPVSAAAAALTPPTTSPGQASRGSSRSPQMSRAQTWFHAPARKSYNGSYWLAVWWSRTYSPVSRPATKELEL